MPLDQTLGRLPVLGPFLAAERNNQAIDSQNLAQAMQQARLREYFQKQEQEKRARAELDAMGPSPQPADLIRWASKHSPPKDVLEHIQRSENVKLQQATVRESTMARLQQAAAQFERSHQARMQGLAQVADENQRKAMATAFDMDYKQKRLMLDNQAQQLAGARLHWDTGNSSFLGGINTQMGGFAPQQSAPQTQTQSLTAPNLSPDIQAAIQALQQGGGGTMYLPNKPENDPTTPGQFGLGGGMQQAAPQPAPQFTPPQPRPQVQPPSQVVPQPAPAPIPQPVSGDVPPPGLSPRGQQEWQLARERERVKANTPRDMPANELSVIRENTEHLMASVRALGLLRGQTVEGQVGDADATGLKGYVPDVILQRWDEVGVPTRAAIGNIGSLRIKQRSGGAVPAAEMERLKPFVPKETDSPATAKTKLTQFVNEYVKMMKEDLAYFENAGRKVPVALKAQMEQAIKGAEAFAGGVVSAEQAMNRDQGNRPNVQQLIELFNQERARGGR